MSATSIDALKALPTVQPLLDRPSEDVVRRASTLPVATLHEAYGRAGALPFQIKPVGRAMRLCGPAMTVHSPGGDNLWLHRALCLAAPGDVLVVHVSGAVEYGYWGEIMSTAAKVRHLGGLVIDGCVRDADLLEEIGFPVFSAGLSIRGTIKDHEARGWINHPVRVGGITICAGDLVAGDRDGLVCISRKQTEEIIKNAQAREAKEALVIQRLLAGESTLDVYNF